MTCLSYTKFGNDLMNVIKRNGNVEEFDFQKIKNAVNKAFKAQYQSDAPEDLIAYLESVSKTFTDDKSVEEIQNFVEDSLMQFKWFDVARSYIKYRDHHKTIRDFAQQKIDFIHQFEKTNTTADTTIDDNANVSNHNIAVLNSEIHKPDNQEVNIKILEDKLKELYPDFDHKQLRRDLNSIAYLHDSSSQIGMPYCVAITMYPFLLNGIKDLGGLSAKPKNLDSFCGMFVNMVFAIASQFKGACMYKDQKLIIQENGVSKQYTSKDLVEKYLNNSIKFSNWQGEWETAIVPDGVKVLEDDKLVSVKKVYRRKYSDKIYEISTRDGHTAKVSKDHIFKQFIQGRQLDIKAEQLQQYDTVQTNYDYSSCINFESIDFKRGWIIGMLCGDGCLTKENSVGLSVNYEQEYLGDIFNEYSSEVFGYTLNKNKGHRCWNYQKYNADYLAKVHEDIIGTTAYDKHIDLNDKSIDYIAGFLDGLFCADGSYSQSHGIAISLTNIKLAENIQTAITYFGLSSNICVTKPRGNRKESYQQYIPSKILKYLKHVHQKVLNRGCKSILDSSREVYFYGANTFQGRVSSNSRHLWSNSKQEVLYKTDVIDNIVTFDNDDEYVYEIETETHWYNCGGFITHNCATPGLLLCMDYFCRKEWGDDYYARANTVITSPDCNRQKTIESQIHQYFQQICYSLMQPSAARGSQAVFWNLSIFDKPFFDTMYSDFYFPDNTKAQWESTNWLQKNFLHWLNQERLKCILTFPVVSVCLIHQDGKFLDEDLYHYACEEYAQGNSFFTYISDSADSLSSCCRLSSKIEKPQFNFTNGQLSEMTGSKNVITLNMNRIVQDWCLQVLNDNILSHEEFGKLFNAKTEDDEGNSLLNPFKLGFKSYLINILERIYKYQFAYDALLKDLYDNNLLSVYKAGFISLKKQYLTIGINGLNQAAEFLGMKCNKNEDYQNFCNLIFTTIKEQNQLHKTSEAMFNTEFTPCESASIKLYNRDKRDGYWVPSDTNLYASYIFKPNDPDISVLDKLYLHGAAYCGDNLDGGSSAHINLDSHLSKKQYEKLLKYAAEVGCKYFGFNVPNCECEECGFIAKQPFDVCPKCGSKNVSLWDRVIGYLVKIKNWSEGRRIEQKSRIYTKEEDVKI